MVAACYRAPRRCRRQQSSGAPPATGRTDRSGQFRVTTSVGFSYLQGPPSTGRSHGREVSSEAGASEVLRLHEWMIGGCALGFMHRELRRGPIPM